MRTNVWEPVGGLNLPKFLLLLIAIFFVVSPVMGTMSTTLDPSDSVYVNATYKLSHDTAVPFNMWVGAILLGVVLILLSFMSGLFQNGEEGLVSIMAWIPVAYAAFSSFAVDRITSAGMGATTGKYILLETHTVYHFDVVAVCLFILLAFAIGNTYRIWISQKRLREMSEGEM